MYGENSGALRDALRELLTQHRIQQRIGGAGTHAVPETTTVDQRREIGELIARYRQSVLVWCRQAMRATNPSFDLSETTSRSREPADELRFRLDASVEGSSASLPTMEDLTSEQGFRMVELWRQAARACALGEHDFGAGVDFAHLSDSQRRTVVHDAAEITRALVGLDRRYANIPGWQHLRDAGRLGRAAELCAAYTGTNEHDHTVDLSGWKPPALLIDGPGLPGIAGVLQAQHNLLVSLGAFPDARSLRVVIDSQRIVSLEAARRLDNPELASRWQRRADTYGRLVHTTRDLGGMLANGGLAAGQGAVAAMRMQKLAPEGLRDAQAVRRLERVSAGIDERLCRVVEYGIHQRLYFQNARLPRLAPETSGVVTPVRSKWLPITGQPRAELLTIVRHDLRPTPIQRKAPEGAAQNRLEFEAAIGHRPEPRGAPPDVPSI